VSAVKYELGSYIPGNYVLPNSTGMKANSQVSHFILCGTVES
jgi:hypothetical protein